MGVIIGAVVAMFAMRKRKRSNEEPEPESSDAGGDASA